MQIIVRDNNVDQALRALKKKLQREGVYREMKLRRHYEKPSEKRARERAAAIRRARKLERKRMEREGTAAKAASSLRFLLFPSLREGSSMSVSQVPLRPIAKGSLVKLWLGVAALVAALAFWRHRLLRGGPVQTVTSTR